MRKDPRAHNTLPVEVTSLIGRQRETSEVKRLLAHSRLVTLTGPGGVGKTRLALHVARGGRGAFADGVWSVPLADLSQPDLIVTTISGRLGSGHTAVGAIEELIAEVGDQQMLVILDNCEHLVDSVAPVVSALLQNCPGVRILATSREALRVAGEALFVVPPLDLPSAGPGVAQVQHYDGVALFLERAGALNADIAAGRYDEQAVAELCRRLDGLPLAIELAAAGSRWMSVEAMLAHSEGVLAPGLRRSRSTADRHQSVRASLDYSFALCSPTARILWAQLAVFRGGATLEAVEAVCGGDGLPPAEIRAALCELVEKSIVVFDVGRYTMLETIRLYGSVCLEESGEAETIRRAHLRHVASIADEIRSDWFGPHQTRLLGTVWADQANVRAALEASLARPDVVGVGLRIVSSLWPFWISSGMPGEGRRWLSLLLDASEAADPERAPALWINGFLCAVNGDIPEARRVLEECEQTASAVGDRATAAHARSSMGIAELFGGNPEIAIEHLVTGVEMERAAQGGLPYLADALINLGLASCYCGDLDRAHAVLTEAAQLCSAHGEGLLLSWALAFLGLESLLRGRPETAAGFARESLVRKVALNNLQGMVWAIELSAWAAVDCGDAQRAAILLGACDARAEDFGPAFHGFAGMREWHDRCADQARASLGPVAYRAGFDQGRRLRLEEAVAVALGEEKAGDEPDTGPLADLPLTRREREIAGLVALGKTNREIADDLVIAPRTVDTHVQHILTKLDFTSRSQVAALVGTAASSRS